MTDFICGISWFIFDCTKLVNDKRGKGGKEEEEHATRLMEKQWENVSQFTQLLILKRVYGPVAAITAYVGFFFRFCLFTALPS